MNQYETSMPAVSFWIIWRMVARQSSNELSHSRSAGATCAADGVASVRVSVRVVIGMSQLRRRWMREPNRGSTSWGPFRVRRWVRYVPTGNNDGKDQSEYLWTRILASSRSRAGREL